MVCVGVALLVYIFYENALIVDIQNKTSDEREREREREKEKEKEKEREKEKEKWVITATKVNIYKFMKFA